MKIFKHKQSELDKIFVALTQCYGELNRIRLILGEKSKKGQWIEKIDKEYNNYDPFFSSEESFDNFKAMKRKPHVDTKKEKL